MELGQFPAKVLIWEAQKIEDSGTAQKKAKTPGVFAFFADVVSTWRGSCTELSLKMVSYVENIKLCIVSSFQRKFTSLELGKRPKGKMAGAKKNTWEKVQKPNFSKSNPF